MIESVESSNTLILIAGPSGSGKSTTSRLLHEAHPDTTSIVHFDDFQFDANALVMDPDGYRNWDDPSFTNFDEAYEKLAQLKAGEAISLMAKNEYDNPGYIKGDYRRKEVQVSPKRVCIAEGHYALLDERILDLSNLSIFLSIDFSTSTARRTKLSNQEYDNRYLKPMHATFVFPTAKTADVVLDITGKSAKDVVTLLETTIGEHGINL